jgi:serine protease Do
VTNNHVVTGAATLEVYVPGEDQPRNARVLGVSECNDLAVIDIDGDGYSFLDWRTDPISSGLEIRALGYPLGDAELTILDGVVSKEHTNGETYWASIDSVIEITADILPGNSGGPVIDEDGNVIGIAYRGNSHDQAFAIGRDVATGLIDTLTSGEDVESIGVNGYAVSTDDGTLTGIWVASVESGSEAQTAGIQGGDIITRMEGLVLATDGTMSDYCDILRTKGNDAPLTVEVLRFDTNTILRGTLPNPLQEAAALGDEDSNDEGTELALDAPFTDRYECVRADGDFECFDDQGIVRVMIFEVPTAEVAAAWEALEGVWLEGDLYSKVDGYGPDWAYDNAPETAVGRLAIYESNTSDMAPYVVQWTYDQAGYVAVAFLDESVASSAYDWWAQNA